MLHTFSIMDINISLLCLVLGLFAANIIHYFH